MKTNFKKNSSIQAYFDSVLLLSLFAFLFFFLLGERPLFVPDEGRYAEIAREMTASAKYITPYLNGIKYFEKPVLFYWLTAAAIKLGGLNLWAIRSVNAILAILGCLFTYAVVKKIYDRLTALFAAIILSTNLLYFVMGHMITLDMPVSVFLSVSLFSFLLADNTNASLKWIALSAVSAALAVLAKGLIGIVFPLLIIVSWMIWSREWQRFKLPHALFALLIFLVIALPWHILVSLKNPEFFSFYIIEQHFLRYTAAGIGHYQPVWFFIPILALGFFPWVVFLPQSLCQSFFNIYKKKNHYKYDLFFLLWAFIIFGFFSFSKSKLIPYILPLFPALAILTARFLVTQLQQKKYLSIQLGFIFLLVVSSIIATYIHFFHTHFALPDAKSAVRYLSMAAGILLLGAMFGFYFTFRQMQAAFLVLIMSAGLFLILILAALPHLDTRTIYPLAKIIKPLLKGKEEVISYNLYYQDLPFYLNRPIHILNWQNELSFGMRHQKNTHWLINDAIFWQKWHSKQRIFVVINLNDYHDLKRSRPEKFYLLGKTLTNALISNYP